MKKPVVEFSRPLQINRVPALGSRDRLAAEDKECAALAARLGLFKVHSLSAFLTSMPWRGSGLRITGKLQAEFDQVSVVSLEIFRSSIECDVERYFLPPHKSGQDSEIDSDIIQDGVVDLGEVVSETLVLELDPYPRRPGEVFQDIHEDAEPVKISHFTGLLKLKRDLGGGKN